MTTPPVLSSEREKEIRERHARVLKMDSWDSHRYNAINQLLQDIPALLAEVSRLRGEVAELNGAGHGHARGSDGECYHLIPLEPR